MTVCDLINELMNIVDKDKRVYVFANPNAVCEVEIENIVEYINYVMIDGSSNMIGKENVNDR